MIDDDKSRDVEPSGAAYDPEDDSALPAPLVTAKSDSASAPSPETDDASGNEKMGESAQSEPLPKEDGDASGIENDAKSPPLSESEPPERSPAKAFAELAQTVHCMRGDLYEIRSFASRCKDKLFRQAEEYELEGKRAVLDSLIRLHDLVYRQVTSMEAGNVHPNPFIINLFKILEGELLCHGVDVVRPQPGDDINLELMITTGTESCPFWRKPNKVARIARCGFILRDVSDRPNLRKAEVTVYKR